MNKVYLCIVLFLLACGAAFAQLGQTVQQKHSEIQKPAPVAPASVNQEIPRQNATVLPAEVSQTAQASSVTQQKATPIPAPLPAAPAAVAQESPKQLNATTLPAEVSQTAQASAVTQQQQPAASASVSQEASKNQTATTLPAEISQSAQASAVTQQQSADPAAISQETHKEKPTPLPAAPAEVDQSAQASAVTQQQQPAASASISQEASKNQTATTLPAEISQSAQASAVTQQQSAAPAAISQETHKEKPAPLPAAPAEVGQEAPIAKNVTTSEVAQNSATTQQVGQQLPSNLTLEQPATTSEVSQETATAQEFDQQISNKTTELPASTQTTQQSAASTQEIGQGLPTSNETNIELPASPQEVEQSKSLGASSSAVEPAPAYGWWRIIHAVANAPAVDVYVDGNLAHDNFNFTMISNYLPILAGNHSFMVTVTGNMKQVLYSASHDILQGNFHDLAIADLMPNPRFLFFGYMAPELLANHSWVEIFHLSHDLMNIPIRARFFMLSKGIESQLTTFEGLLYSQPESWIAQFKQIPSGTWSVELVNANTNEVLRRFDDVDLEDNSLHTIAAF